MNERKLTDDEQIFRIASMIISKLAYMQDLEETTLKKIRVEDGGELIYVTISGALTTESIDIIGGLFGDGNPIVRSNDDGIEICIGVDYAEEWNWIKFTNDICIRFDYTLESPSLSA